MDTDNLLTKFKDWLFSRNYSEITIDGYIRDIRQYLKYAEGLDVWDKITIMGFMGHCRAKGNQGNTLRRKFYCIKTYFESCEQTFPLNKRDVPKASSKTKVMLVNDERKTISAAAKGKLDEKASAIIHIEEALGLRRIEFRFLEMQDYKRPHLYVRTQKHGIPVKRLLTDKACDELDRWFAIRVTHPRVKPRDALFNTAINAEPLSLRTLSRIFKRARTHAGIDGEKVGYHSFRRGIVTETLKGGVRYSEVTAEFGWRDKRTVLEYDITDAEEAQRSILEKSPIFAEQGNLMSRDESNVPVDVIPAPLTSLAGINEKRVETPEQRRMRLIGQVS